jgi:hypothetical protein
MPGIEDLFRTFGASTDTNQILIRVLKEAQAVASGIGAGDGVSVVSRVALNAANVTLKVANPNRKSLIITNDSNQILYVKQGATASPTTSYTWKVGVDEVVVIEGYLGIVDGIWAGAGTGAAYITETT